SADGSSTQTAFDINIIDDTTTDQDDVLTGKTIADIDTAADEISESASLGDAVHITANVVDADGDAVTYELTDDFHSWFAIDASTGVVTVKGNIDYESDLLTDHKAT
ncbi:cadherin repeat domain-containing protein, partial [Marinifilum sp. D737]|uniref:cadherin repeat domain-containing protein n=1 Tax=Marinifilum sp. D737 TaxID=2969628 RepID=UPI0022735A9C